jgi:hypothetical protein
MFAKVVFKKWIKKTEKIMKKRNAGLLFTCGALFGLSIALCLGAVEKANQTPTKDWSQLKFVAYPNGGTGVFDPATGTMYVYDSDLRGCYLVRRINNLGQPMFRP